MSISIHRYAVGHSESDDCSKAIWIIEPSRDIDVDIPLTNVSLLSTSETMN